MKFMQLGRTSLGKVFHPHDHFAVASHISDPAVPQKKLGLNHAPRVKTIHPPMILEDNVLRKPEPKDVVEALITLRKEVHQKLYGKTRRAKPKPFMFMLNQ